MSTLEDMSKANGESRVIDYEPFALDMKLTTLPYKKLDNVAIVNFFQFNLGFGESSGGQNTKHQEN